MTHLMTRSLNNEALAKRSFFLLRKEETRILFGLQTKKIWLFDLKVLEKISQKIILKSKKKKNCKFHLFSCALV